MFKGFSGGRPISEEAVKKVLQDLGIIPVEEKNLTEGDIVAELTAEEMREYAEIVKIGEELKTLNAQRRSKQDIYSLQCKVYWDKLKTNHKLFHENALHMDIKGMAVRRG